MKHSAAIKQVAAHLDNASDEDRKGLQKVMRFYDESDEEERRLLLQFISKPKRVVRSRRKGFKLPPNTICVNRPTKWGNPFTVEESGSNAEAVRLHQDWLFKTPAGREVAAAAAKVELKGKNLACFCPLSEPCHADTLLELVNAGE